MLSAVVDFLKLCKAHHTGIAVRLRTLMCHRLDARCTVMLTLSLSLSLSLCLSLSVSRTHTVVDAYDDVTTPRPASRGQALIFKFHYFYPFQGCRQAHSFTFFNTCAHTETCSHTHSIHTRLRSFVDVS